MCSEKAPADSTGLGAQLEDLIAVAEHLPDVFQRNFSGAVASARMPFAENPEWLPTVHQINAMDAKDSSERMRYFASLFILTYLATVLLGTCIMMLGPKCGCCGGNGSHGGWQAMVTMVTETCNEDGTSSEDAKSSEDADKPAWRIVEEKEFAIRSEIWYKLDRRERLVTVVFSAVFCTSLAAAIFSLTTDRLSKRTGLDWEIYFLLFTLNCIWLILQAIVAATRAARTDSNFAITAFFEGTMSGTWPVISDSYDTLKDVLVGALCLHSDSTFLQVLGVISWLYLAAIHVSFIRHSSSLSELLASYAPIWVMHTALSKRADGHVLEDSSGCCPNLCSQLHGFLILMRDTLIVQAYRQVTPIKRGLLAVENIFQGMVGIAYMVIEGGSVFVVLLNVVIPIIQIFLSFLLYKPLRRKVAPWFAKRLKSAMENKDLIMEEQIRHEAFQDVGIFAAVAPHLAGYEGFTELQLKFGGQGIDDAGAVELAAALAPSVEQLQLKTLVLYLSGNSIGDAGALALAEAVRRMPRLEVVDVELEGNDLGAEGRAAWRSLEGELESRRAKVRIFLDETRWMWGSPAEVMTAR